MAPSQTATRTTSPTRTPPAAPLTTVFTQPQSCSTLENRFETSICMPPSWSQYRSDKVGYYSPGVCPESYSSACGRPTTGSYGPALDSGETAAICCPNQYSCAEENASYCISGDRFAFAIQVRWKSSDLAILAKATSSHSLSATASPGSSITAAQTSTSSSHVSGGSGGLTTSEKAAIGVVVPIVVLGILAGILFFCQRRKRRRKGAPSPSPAIASEKLRGLDSPTTITAQSPQLEPMISSDGSLGFSPTTTLPLAATVSNLSQPEYISGQQTTHLAEALQTVLRSGQNDRLDDEIQPIPIRIPQPYPTPFLVRTNSEQTSFGFPIDRSIQATPTQAYVRPVPFSSLAQHLPTTPEAREEHEASPLSEKDPHGVYSLFPSSNESRNPLNPSSDPTSMTSLLHSDRRGSATSPASPGSSRSIPSTYKYTTDVKVTEVEPLSPLASPVELMEASPIVSPGSSPTSDSPIIVSPTSTLLLLPNAPPLLRNPSENAPMPISPPGHVYPEAVSVQFPFPAPSTRPSPQSSARRRSSVQLPLPSTPGPVPVAIDTGTPTHTALPDSPTALEWATSPSPRSPTSGGGGGGGFGDDDEEVQRLRMKQQRIRKRRARLTELASLDEEEARLRRSLDERLRRLASKEGAAKELAGEASDPASNTS